MLNSNRKRLAEQDIKRQINLRFNEALKRATKTLPMWLRLLPRSLRLKTTKRIIDIAGRVAKMRLDRALDLWYSKNEKGASV